MVYIPCGAHDKLVSELPAGVTLALNKGAIASLEPVCCGIAQCEFSRGGELYGSLV